MGGWRWRLIAEFSAARVVALITKIGGHAGIQVVSQLLSFATGILVVRELSTTGYAQYAICTTVMAAFLLLSDSGISATLMSRGAQLLNDRIRFTGLFKAARRSRLLLSVPIIMVGSAWAFVLLHQNSAGPGQSIIWVSLTIVGTIATLDSSMQQVVHRLHYRLTALRILSVGQAVLRLGLTAVGLAFPAPAPEFFLGTMAASAVGGAIYMRIASKTYVDSAIPADRSTLESFRLSIYKTAPMIVLLIAGEQAFLGLLSAFGTTQTLSEFSALSRFGVAFLVLNTLVSDIAAPLVARTANVYRAVVSRIFASAGLYALASALLVLLIWIFSEPILEILGGRFDGLSNALVLTAAGYAIYNLGHGLNFLTQARGWLSGSWTYGPLIVLWAVLTPLLFDLGNLNEVSLAFICQGAVFVLVQFVRILIGSRRMKRS